jgi:hypothetical protein
MITLKNLLKYLWDQLNCLWHGNRPVGYWEWFYEGWDYDYDGSQAWLCVCGHYQEDGLHCECCGAEPPWGCDCGLCDELRQEEANRDEWLAMWEDYPGELLEPTIGFLDLPSGEVKNKKKYIYIPLRVSAILIIFHPHQLAFQASRVVSPGRGLDYCLKLGILTIEFDADGVPF